MAHCAVAATAAVVNQAGPAATGTGKTGETGSGVTCWHRRCSCRNRLQPACFGPYDRSTYSFAGRPAHWLARCSLHYDHVLTVGTCRQVLPDVSITA
jgi:hypothetical protein